MGLKKFMSLSLASTLLVLALSGCGEKTSNAETGNTETTSSDETASVDIEAWNVNNGFLEVKKDSETYNFYKEITGVGITQPYVEWNGGTTYQEQLNLRIAAGEMPDLFYPVNGMEVDLAKNGALLDLTDLLPEKAPHLWNSVPEEVWNIVKANDPTGQGRIYMIPSIVEYPQTSALIRQDWLDTLGLEMPTTQEEFVEVLRLFKEEDPNGNGQADELPTGGRSEARWMDYIFAMYGIAMYEGYPQFDVYDGELTYSAVTENMKDALAFASELYAEGLLDPETLLNDKAAWDGKINSNKVGVYYHWAQSSYEYATAIENATGVKADIAAMPVINAEGYEGFYTAKTIRDPRWVVAYTEDEAKIDAVMKVLDAYGNEELWETFYLGVEGMHSEMVDGKLSKLPDDKKTQENIILDPIYNFSTIENTTALLESAKSDETSWAIDRSITNVQETEQYGKVIANSGMPNSVYEGYADIMNRTLYVQYASKIITGEYTIDKFDEFVEKWHSSGGEQVTQAARTWYASTQK